MPESFKAGCSRPPRSRSTATRLFARGSQTRSVVSSATSTMHGTPLCTRAMVLGLVFLLFAAAAYGQGYNSGGYGGKTGATGGGGGGSITGGSCSPNQFATAVGPTGVPTCVQPAAGAISGLAPSATTDTTNASNITSGTLSGGRLPAPTSSTLGGVLSNSLTAHNWTTYIDTSGVAHQAQPAAGDISGLAPSATTDTTNASNISSGNVAPQRLSPAASAHLNNYYAANGQTMPTFGGIESNGSGQVTELTPPTGVACSCTGGTGTTYTYAVSSIDYPMTGSAGGYQPPGLVIQGPGGESSKSTAVTCSGPSSLSYPSDYCTVSWNGWSDVAGYKVWGRTSSTNSLTDISKNYGSGGIAATQFVDFGWYTPASSAQYMTGIFKAECGLGTGDWSWSSWPSSNCGDVFFKESGSTKENIVVGTTNNQITTDSSGYLHLIALNGLELQGAATDTNGRISSGYWPRPPFVAPVPNAISGTGPASNPLAAVLMTDGLYVESISASFNGTFTCSSPVFAVYDCGTAASCSSPTSLGTVAPTAAGITAGSITTHAVAAGHYLAIALSSGSCTADSGSVAVEYAGN